MNSLIAPSLILILASFSAAASGSQRVCVSPVKVKSVDRGLVLPPPSNPDLVRSPGRDYFVQIDDGPQTAVRERAGTLLSVVPGRESYLFKVYRDARIVHSFRFTLASGAKCVIFQPAHESWSFTDVTYVSACGCK